MMCLRNLEHPNVCVHRLVGLSLTKQSAFGAWRVSCLFFRHVDNVIFNEHEIRSLQALLADYKRIVGDYGYQLGDVKSSYLNELLIDEYQDTTGFKERREMYKSEWVYLWRSRWRWLHWCSNVIRHQRWTALAERAQGVSKRVKSTSTVPWPPNVDDMKEGEELCEFFVQPTWYQ